MGWRLSSKQDNRTCDVLHFKTTIINNINNKHDMTISGVSTQHLTLDKHTKNNNNMTSSMVQLSR